MTLGNELKSPDNLALCETKLGDSKLILAVFR